LLTAEEIAVIVPIPENVFDDTEFNVWENVKPRIVEACAKVLDLAVFFGVGKPSTWPTSLTEGARAAGNVYSAATAGDLAEDLNQTMALVEADGFDANIIYAARTMKALLRGLRDSQGRLIYAQNLTDATPTSSVYGVDVEFVPTNTWNAPVAAHGTSPVIPEAGASAIIGDRNAAILGVRQDLTFKVLTEATVNGVNLAETDRIALRAKMRVAFQVADPTTAEGGSGAYPFAVLGL
jgi:HK97 family phage major capsid protein